MKTPEQETPDDQRSRKGMVRAPDPWPVVAKALVRALRDAEAMDNCEPTSGGEADTYEKIKARRLAALALHDEASR